VTQYPEGLPQQPYTVVGCWAQTRARYASLYRAVTTRAAEDQAQMDAQPGHGTLWVCRVVPGEHDPADRYTAFVDPYDPRNADIKDLVRDTPVLGELDPDWTVLGIAAPPGTPDHAMLYTGERYGDIVPAASALAAEDVARDRLRDQGGVLMVCAVLRGQVPAADTYATFVNPDVTPRM
jgi:hypothetical protein